MKLKRLLLTAAMMILVFVMVPVLASADELATATDLSHVHVLPDNWTVVQAPTCTNYGIETRTCRRCSYTQVRYVDSLPHPYGEWKIITEATDHSAGVRERICRVCGNVDHGSFDPAGTLRMWSSGPAVKAIQKTLYDKGYLHAADIDGDYGPNTVQAITLFQMDNGLTADGVAWPQTIKILRGEASTQGTSSQNAEAGGQNSSPTDLSNGLTDLSKHG